MQGKHDVVLGGSGHLAQYPAVYWRDIFEIASLDGRAPRAADIIVVARFNPKLPNGLRYTKFHAYLLQKPSGQHCFAGLRTWGSSFNRCQAISRPIPARSNNSIALPAQSLRRSDGLSTMSAANSNPLT